MGDGLGKRRRDALARLPVAAKPWACLRIAAIAAAIAGGIPAHAKDEPPAAEDLRRQGNYSIYTYRSDAKHRFEKDGDAQIADAHPRKRVQSYDRWEQRPPDARLGNRFLSATGDFDADGLLDEVFFAEFGRVLRLVVAFGSPTKRDRVIGTIKKRDSTFRRIGVKVAPAGQYTDICAYGIPDPCTEGEEPLALPHDGFIYFYFEATATLFYLPEDALDGDFKTLSLAD